MSLFLDNFVDDAIDDLFFCSEEKWEAASSQGRRSSLSVGETATARLVGMLQRIGFSVSREDVVPVLNEEGHSRARRLDVVAEPKRSTGAPRPSYVYESKYIGNPRGRDVESIVRRHAREAQEKQRGIRAVNLLRAEQRLPLLSEQIRLIYQLPSDTPRDVAVNFQRNASRWADPVRVTVIMPGSEASRAPLAQVRPGLLHSTRGGRRGKGQLK